MSSVWHPGTTPAHRNQRLAEGKTEAESHFHTFKQGHQHLRMSQTEASASPLWLMLKFLLLRAEQGKRLGVGATAGPGDLRLWGRHHWGHAMTLGDSDLSGNFMLFSIWASVSLPENKLCLSSFEGKEDGEGSFETKAEPHFYLLRSGKVQMLLEECSRLP